MPLPDVTGAHVLRQLRALPAALLSAPATHRRIDLPSAVQDMEPRISETAMGMMGMKTMRMTRVEMKKQDDPHNKGITFEKFAEHRGYAMPGYEPKHPKDGDAAPDGTILSIDGGESSTLLAEARKLAKLTKGMQGIAEAKQALSTGEAIGAGWSVAVATTTPTVPTTRPTL